MIELNSIQKLDEEALTLQIDSLVVKPFEIAACIGPIEEGLSLLFDMLIGRMHPTFGKIRICGFDPATEREAFGQYAGVLFEQDGLYKQRTARQNLAFMARLRGGHFKIDELLHQLGLSEQASVRAKNLIPGQARRLAFGCATVHEPEALILYLPFIRCDSPSITLITNQIEANAERGAAVLILVEDPAHLETACGRYYTIEKGIVTEAEKPVTPGSLHLPFKIPVRLEGRVVLLNPGDILYAEAVEGRTFLHTSEEKLPSQYTLSDLEERLLRSGFFRAHRSYLVNLQHIKEVIPFTRNSYSLRLDDALSTLIPLSRNAAAELKELLGF